MKIGLVVLIMSFICCQSYASSASDTVSSGTYQSLPGIIDETVVDKIMCEDGLQINDHMGRMGFIIRKLSELVQNLIIDENIDEVRAIIMVDTQVLRTHLTAVLPKTPEKVKNIDKDHIQKNKIIYQRYLAKMILYTIDLEEEILKRPMTPDELANQRIKVASLIIKINDTVDEAHSLFRD